MTIDDDDVKVIVVVREALFSVVREQCREMSVQSPCSKSNNAHFLL